MLEMFYWFLYKLGNCKCLTNYLLIVLHNYPPVSQQMCQGQFLFELLLPYKLKRSAPAQQTSLKKLG